MQMDMQEPGEMCYCRREEHHPTIAGRELENKIGLHASVYHIIISCMSTDHVS